MGVKGLWQLLEPTGHPVTLEALEGKVLAVDVSIWLHQTMRGMRDKHGNPLPNAHLLGLFHRVCKLLFSRIKPIFVFDGGVPQLKKLTMMARRQKKLEAAENSQKVTRKMLENFLKQQAVKTVLAEGEQGVRGAAVISQALPSSSTADKGPDMFQLPATPLVVQEDKEDTEMEGTEDLWEERLAVQSQIYDEFQVLDNIDTDSADFRSLPLNVQHEILTEIKDEQRRHHWANLSELPEDSDDFSKYQMAKLMKQSKLSKKISNVRKELNVQNVGKIVTQFAEEEALEFMESQRIISETNTHYILIKHASRSKKQETSETQDTELLAGNNESQEMHDCQITEQHSVISQPVMHDIDVEGNIKTKTVVMSERAAAVDVIDEEERTMTAVMNERAITDDAMDEEEGNKSDVMNERAMTNDVIEVEEQGRGDGMWSSDRESNMMESKIKIKVEKVEELPTEALEFSIKESMSNEAGRDSILVNTDLIPTAKQSIDIKENVNESAEGKYVEQVTGKKVQLLEKDLNKMGHIDGKHFQKSFDMNDGIPNTSFLSQESTSARSLLDGNIQSSHSESAVDLGYNSSSEESDDDFIEVPIDIPKVPYNIDTFPGSMFTTTQPAKDCDVTDDGKDTAAVAAAAGCGSELKASVNAETTGETISPGSSPVEIIRIDDDDNELETLTVEELLEIQENLVSENTQLAKERGHQQRLATSITDQMYQEAQELLSLFGVPFVVSPMEAEAQCAFLDYSCQTDGAITDDSDIWLFGGQRVYKNFFNQNKSITFFKLAELETQLMLDRQKFINIALLCGSDYTEGVEGIGPVLAMEALAEFPGAGVDQLTKFREWWDFAQTQPAMKSFTKVKNVLRHKRLPQGFPSQAICEAYLNPVIDQSTEPFSWSLPDLDLLRTFTNAKFGWSQAKADEFLLPVIKQIRKRDTQSHITSFFLSSTIGEPKGITSKRLKRVLTKMRCPDPATSSGSEVTWKTQGKSKTGRGRKAMKGSAVKQRARSIKVPEKRVVDLNLSESEDSSESSIEDETAVKKQCTSAKKVNNKDETAGKKQCTSSKKVNNKDETVVKKQCTSAKKVKKSEDSSKSRMEDKTQIKKQCRSGKKVHVNRVK